MRPRSRPQELGARPRIYGPEARRPIEDIAVDRVFIGSCTNARIEDLRAAAKVVNGYHVRSHVRAMVVPGSQQVKRQAEEEGLDEHLPRRRL